MADKKISELDAVGTSADTDQIPVVQSGTTKRATLAQIMTAGGVDRLEAAWTDTVMVEGDDSTRTTRATAVQSAIDDAVAAGSAFVLVPHRFLNYDASAVTFDDSVRMVREGHVSEGYDVKAYGAAGDGTTDDTPAIQATFDAAHDNEDVRAPVRFPRGDFLVTDTLTVQNVRGLIVSGVGGQFRPSSGTRIRCEIANATKHLFDVSNTARCHWSDFHVIADEQAGGGETVDSIFRSANENLGVSPSKNMYANLRIDGVGAPGGFKRGWFFDGSGAGGDQNNESNCFRSCEVQDPTEEGWLIDHSQSKRHLLEHCRSSGGKHIVRSAGSFIWQNNAGGGQTSQAAFKMDNPNGDGILISGFNLEGCDRLFEGGGAGTNANPVIMRDGRFATDALNVDEFVVFTDHPGPIILDGITFSNTNPVLLRLNGSPGSPDIGIHARITECAFRANGPGNTPWSFTPGTGSEIVTHGNTFSGAATGVEGAGLIADGDATPSVLGATLFNTQNTGATTITGLDDGYYGQEVKVVFGDGNTTVDFTGTTLKGNAGVDWTPAANDHMTCVYDGTNWYCDISDNTA